MAFDPRELHAQVLEEFAEHQERNGEKVSIFTLELRRRKDRERKRAKRAACRRVHHVTRTCPACGGEFVATVGRGHRPRRYCDDVCRETAYRRRGDVQERGDRERRAEVYRLSAATLLDPRTVDRWLDDPTSVSANARRILVAATAADGQSSRLQQDKV
jgi:hypothetical protein